MPTATKTATMAQASTSQQLQGVMETQVAMLRELAESQQQIAQMLAEGGLGQNIDIRILVVRTLLTYLEADGYLEGGTPFYSDYQFKPLLPSREILTRFDGQRRRFLADLFRQARKARTWFRIELDNAASHAVDLPDAWPSHRTVRGDRSGGSAGGRA